MDEKVQKEYDALLAAVAVKNGALLDLPNNREYGWISQDWPHLRTCGVKSYGVASEINFEQFEGTFAPSSTRYAIDVADVDCNCGRIIGREIRWEPIRGISEIAETVFAALYEKMSGERGA